MPERRAPLFKPSLLEAIREGRKTQKKTYPRTRFGECQTSPSHIARRIAYGIERIDESGCWIWGRHINNMGYGKMTILGRGKFVHREVWFQLHGPIESGMCVCHVCDNPSCVNPDHLFLATHTENMRDCSAKGRHGPPPIPCPGESNGCAKLTASDVGAIRGRLASGETQSRIAKDYPVTQSQISNINRGLAWA